MNTTLDLKDTNFDLVLKLSERCNLACKYCYYYFQEYDVSRYPAIMPSEVRDEMPEFLARSITDLHLDQINIGLHGGEPLLMKKPVFDEFCGQLNTALEGRVRYRIGVQTNAVLVDDEWIDIFAKHGIRVGVSVDGTKEIHDDQRVDHAGRGSYDRVLAGLTKLREAVEAGRLKGCGVLGVVPRTQGREALSHMVHGLGESNPSLNFPRGGWNTEYVREWNASIESHRDMVRYALNNLVAPKFHKVRGITDVLMALRSEFSARLNDFQIAQRHNVATITSSGMILPDDNLLSTHDCFSEAPISIFGHSLRDYVESTVYRSLTKAIDEAPESCGDCEWYRLCRGGLIFNRYSDEEGLGAKSALCDTLKMIFEECAAFLLTHTSTTIADLEERLSGEPSMMAADVYRRLTGIHFEPQENTKCYSKASRTRLKVIS